MAPLYTVLYFTCLISRSRQPDGLRLDGETKVEGKIATSAALGVHATQWLLFLLICTCNCRGGGGTPTVNVVCCRVMPLLLLVCGWLLDIV